MFHVLEAIKLIFAIKRNPEKANNLKRTYENKIGSTEVFLEATPTVLILIFIARNDYENGTSIILVGGQNGNDVWIFVTSFVASVLSASFGLAKCLKFGVCRLIAEGGAMDGYFTCRFFMAFLSCGSVLWAKGFMIGVIEVVILDVHRSSIQVAMAFCFGLFIPNMALALWSSVGSSKSSLKMLIHHPSIIILPMFTFFTFSKMSTGCCGKEDNRVRFSPVYTCINILISCGYWGLWVAQGGLLSQILGVPVQKG